MATAQYQEIRLFSGFAEIPMEDGSIKTIAVEDLSEILAEALETEAKIEPMLLPPNCYMISRTASRMKISCYYAGEKRVIKFHDRSTNKTKDFNIPFPNVIITHDLHKEGDAWVAKQALYFATNKSVGQLSQDKFITAPDHQDQIWTLPFSNIYEGGNACYGGNSMIYRFENNNFRGLDWYFRFLFTAPFNNDLGVRSVADRDMTPAKWYKFLSTQEAFPYNKLYGYKEQ